MKNKATTRRNAATTRRATAALAAIPCPRCPTRYDRPEHALRADVAARARAACAVCGD